MSSVAVVTAESLFRPPNHPPNHRCPVACAASQSPPSKVQVIWAEDRTLWLSRRPNFGCSGSVGRLALGGKTIVVYHIRSPR